MSIAIINPGSHVEGGTIEQARRNAEAWLEEMRENGIHDVEIVDWLTRKEDGRWVFVFRHLLTRVHCELAIDGLTREEKERLLFWPKVYWRWSSCSEPALTDFLAEGYRIAIVPEDTP